MYSCTPFPHFNDKDNFPSHQQEKIKKDAVLTHVDDRIKKFIQ